MLKFVSTPVAKTPHTYGARHFVYQISALALLVGLTACSGSGGTAPATAPPEPISAPPSPPASPPPSTVNLTSETDINYGSGLLQSGALDLKLDIYQPDGACITARPFVLGLHGGGFVGGSKSDTNWIDNMNAIVARGYAGLSVDYRLAGDNPVISAEFQPILDDFESLARELNLSESQLEVLNAAVAAFEDTVTALDWVQANAEARCLDPSNFALWGSSAGAITALHVGHSLDNYFIDRLVPKVVIDYWGRLLLSGQIGADDPPFMIIHGTADTSQIYADTALILAAEADLVGLPYSFYTVQGGPHGFGSINPERVTINGTTARAVTLDFIAAHLDGTPPLYESQTIIPSN